MSKNKIETNDFLVEIHTEELPPKALHRLAKAFLHEIITRLHKAELKFADAKYFATPRRLAVMVTDLVSKQADTTIERKGPAFNAAFDKDGNPSQACIGFAKSCNVTPDQLIKLENKGGTFVGYMQKMEGKHVQELLPAFVQQSLAALPIPKRMRWNSGTVEFVRPVHSVIMLYGDDVIDAEILGCRAGRETQGHRFMSKGWLEVKNPSKYASVLEKGHVIVDFERRKEMIREQAKKIESHVNIEENLLDEVTALVEWPVAIEGKFDKAFLQVPQEALISAMQDHQRYFPVLDKHGKLQAKFVTISNIESKDPAHVSAGNERVLRARLSDAAFFFETDKKVKLEDRVETLKNIVFQAKLGTLYDKTQRVMRLAGFIADKMNVDKKLVERAALLSKTDLTTDLVGEFPELQGTAGFYYAQQDGESEAVAIALNEQYMPRFSGAPIPETMVGCVLAIADRLDTLVGIFSVGMIPTGDKDPFGLRRAAIGVLRMLIEKEIDLDMLEVLRQADSSQANAVWAFMQERLRALYQEQNVSSDVFAAVSALNITNPYDFHCRIQAVQAFKNMTEAEALSVANKRVSNILAKYESEIAARKVDSSLFDSDVEKVLAQKLEEQQKVVVTLSQSAKYQEVLTHLAKLRKPVDDFFDHVMVMVDDKPKRENRLLMLKQLRELFLQVADIALLQ